MHFSVQCNCLNSCRKMIRKRHFCVLYTVRLRNKKSLSLFNSYPYTSVDRKDLPDRSKNYIFSISPAWHFPRHFHLFLLCCSEPRACVELEEYYVPILNRVVPPLLAVLASGLCQIIWENINVFLVGNWQKKCMKTWKLEVKNKIHK